MKTEPQPQPQPQLKPEAEPEYQYDKYTSTEGNQIPREKLAEFYEKVKELAREEFGVDMDNNPPIQIQLVDRTRYWGLGFHPLKMEHACEENDDFYFDQLEMANLNIGIAQREADVILRQWDCYRSEK